MKPSWLWSLLPLASLACAESNDTMLWGAYRPNLYFGLRPRIPQSLMTGLMWFSTHDYQSISRTRHACDQGDNLQGYTWTEYDSKEGGVQVINDLANNVQITTEFLKIPGGDHGGSWAVRIKGKPMVDSRPSKPSLLFYFGLEGLGGLEMDSEENENGLDGDIVLTGSSPELDDFTIRIIDDDENTLVTEGPHSRVFQDRLGKTHYMGRPLPAGTVWQAKEVVLQSIIKRAQEVLQPYQKDPAGPPDPAFTLQLPDNIYSNSNLYVVQKTFSGPFQFDILFESASANQKLTPAVLDHGIPALQLSYDERFQRAFPYPSDYPIEAKDGLMSFSKAVTSNLLGGVGYFYGTSIVNRKFSYEWDEEEDADTEEEAPEKGAGLTEPRSLLTATPSRSFFPRGFYWDEGFHLLHIGTWDEDFSLQILKDWINLIDDDGWVAREQILGEEARSKVPVEFQTQVPNYANPPTLTMAVTAYIARVRAAAAAPSDVDLGMQVPMGDEKTSGALQQEEALTFLKSIYQPLKRHYHWFRRTQRGQIKQYGRQARSRTEAYRWRGRSATHVLTSGMDDYPRGPPHAGELHLDLMSWMAFFTGTMRDIAGFIGETDDELSYLEIEKSILDNLEDLHWSEEQQMYCDAGVDDEDESYFVCHKGYLSLFPLLLELLPADSPHLGAILDMLRDPQHLWSPYGIRSLSASHPEYGQGEDYWKGPIWMPMNYLALRALYNKYTVLDGPYKARAQEIYDELRRNVVDNVYKEYERTGYVWEQYDAKSGEGRRSHPFTGWTSLVVLILTEKY